MVNFSFAWKARLFTDGVQCALCFARQEGNFKSAVSLSLKNIKMLLHHYAWTRLMINGAGFGCTCRITLFRAGLDTLSFKLLSDKNVKNTPSGQQPSLLVLHWQHFPLSFHQNMTALHVIPLIRTMIAS
jgi:hypothetical protein